MWLYVSECFSSLDKGDGAFVGERERESSFQGVGVGKRLRCTGIRGDCGGVHVHCW